MDLNILLNTTSDGVAVTDAQGKFTFFNRAHCALFGYDDDVHLLGQSWKVLYPDEEIQRIEAKALPALAKTGHWQGLMQAKKRDGSLFDERLSLSMLTDGGILCICNEWSEEQILESKLGQAWNKRSEEMERRGRLFSLANHEMRAPLTSILLATEMLGLPHNTENPKKHDMLIRQILSQVSRVGDLMDKFLFLGGQFSGVLPFTPETTDLRAFLKQYESENWGLQDRGGAAKVVASIRGDLFERTLDPTLLKHCLGNLLANAVKYCDERTDIELILDLTDPDKLNFSVYNRGPTPEPETMSNLFEPFARHEYPEAPQAHGSGLGLYLVRECVRAHGGDVAFEALKDGVRVSGWLLTSNVNKRKVGNGLYCS